jgi:Tol biopolymer transport system component
MAFTNREEENLDIYFMNLSEGSTIQRVSNTDEEEYGFTFSPDEEKLFFVRYEQYSLNLIEDW